MISIQASAFEIRCTNKHRFPRHGNAMLVIRGLVGCKRRTRFRQIRNGRIRNKRTRNRRTRNRRIRNRRTRNRRTRNRWTGNRRIRNRRTRNRRIRNRRNAKTLLKSPVMRNSCGVVAVVEMKVWKSMIKSDKGTGSCVGTSICSIVIAIDIEDSEFWF